MREDQVGRRHAGVGDKGRTGHHETDEVRGKEQVRTAGDTQTFTSCGTSRWSHMAEEVEEKEEMEKWATWRDIRAGSVFVRAHTCIRLMLCMPESTTM